MRFNEALGMPNDESKAKAHYEQAMHESRVVVDVLAPTYERKQRSMDILLSHGAYDAV